MASTEVRGQAASPDATPMGTIAEPVPWGRRPCGLPDNQGQLWAHHPPSASAGGLGAPECSEKEPEAACCRRCVGLHVKFVFASTPPPPSIVLPPNLKAQHPPNLCAPAPSCYLSTRTHTRPEPCFPTQSTPASAREVRWGWRLRFPWGWVPDSAPCCVVLSTSTHLFSTDVLSFCLFLYSCFIGSPNTE